MAHQSSEGYATRHERKIRERLVGPSGRPLKLKPIFIRRILALQLPGIKG
jgi:hypothetical protein